MDNEISWIWGVVLVILLIPAIHLFVDLLNSSSSPGQTQARRDKSNYQQLMYFEARATRKVLEAFLVKEYLDNPVVEPWP